MKLVFVTIIALGISESRADSWESLVQRLTQTRADLEALSKESDSLQREKQSDLDQWTQRKAESEAQVVREKTREMQITEKLKRLEARVKVSGKADPQAQKKLRSWIESFETMVAASIPFQREARLQSLSRLKERVAKNHEPMEFIFADFWSFLESELKLAQTNEYKIVDVDISGKTKKCEVARLGLLSLFVVTPGGQTLKATKVGGEWKWRDVESSTEQISIQNLVKNLKNKMDSGIYQLPVNAEKMGASL